MIELNVLTDSTVGLASFGLVGARFVFAKAAIEATARHTQIAVEEFKKKQLAHFTSLEEPHTKALDGLVEVLRESDEAQQAARAGEQNVKLPEVNLQQQPLTDLQQALDEVGAGIGKTFKRVWGRKISRTIKSEAHERMFHVSEGVGHHAPNWGPVEKAIIDVGDAAGLTDTIALVGDIAVDIVPGAMLEAADMVFDFLVPGAASFTRSIYKEASMLINGKTNIHDSLTGGLLPATQRAGLVGIGVTIDTAFGWTTCGLFTVAGMIFGSLCRNEVPKERIKENSKELKKLAGKIDNRRRKATDAISAATNKNLETVQGEIETCPHLTDEPSMHALMATLADNYVTDRKTIIHKIHQACESIIQSLPELSWKDRVLFINRRVLIESLYREAAQEVSDDLKKGADHFVTMAHTAPHQAIETLREGYLAGGQTAETLLTIPALCPELQSKYQASLRAWNIRCVESWGVAIEAIKKVIQDETRAVDRVASETKYEMDDLRSGIRADLRRLGLQPSLCP